MIFQGCRSITAISPGDINSSLPCKPNQLPTHRSVNPCMHTWIHTIYLASCIKSRSRFQHARVDFSFLYQISLPFNHHARVHVPPQSHSIRKPIRVHHRSSHLFSLRVFLLPLSSHLIRKPISMSACPSFIPFNLPPSSSLSSWFSISLALV